jgi:hypothetical protein
VGEIDGDGMPAGKSVPISSACHIRSTNPGERTARAAAVCRAAIGAARLESAQTITAVQRRIKPGAGESVDKLLVF